MSKNLCFKTIITTIGATVAYAIVIYLLKQSFEMDSIITFAVVFGIIFFLGQKYFSKKKK